MKTSKLVPVLLVILTMACGLACTTKAKAPDVSSSIRQALDQAENEKTQAESIARSIAGDQVVSNQIGIRPAGDESTAKKVDSDLDKGIDKNVDAALTQRKWNHDIRYDVKNGVVTLKGTVNSESRRTAVEKVVAQVPNVKQVVNEVEVKNQKATSTARNQ
jgi:osmotically-inducible protein OsmY